MKTKINVISTSNISQIIQEESLKSKIGKSFMIGPDAEIEFNIKNWEKVTDKIQKIVLKRQANQIDPLDFISKTS
jgi:hypothetical protein